VAAPTVSFVVPCYKLAHLLGECLSSIMSQSYGHFEALILDDCSPDNTPEVARSFHDPRVVHIRNERNLGHLRNYNHGIELARGKYIWLISADDRLRRSYILERYIKVMEANPRVGYACCPAISLDKSDEAHLEGSVSSRDAVFSGRTFARKLLERGNFVIAASGMVRRECYEKLGTFPLDLPYAGDWYLWCLFALHYDVAYFSEPMVNYRQHDLSMTNQLTGERFATRFKDGLAVLWRMHQKAEELGEKDIVKLCRQRIAYQYGHNILGRKLGESTFSMSVEEFESSLQENADSSLEANIIRARTWEIVADGWFRRREFERAQSCYALGRTYDDSRMTVAAKQLLLDLGVGHLVVDLKDKVVDVRRTLTEFEVPLTILQHSTESLASQTDGGGPMVSFVVPCYKLAHLLRECIDSILNQTYGDFEILIMDDCSPDDTAEVVHSLADPRLSYIRNERNLGHLANYNKGILLSQGKYVWLISADDRLRRPYVLERFVRLMEGHPNVGYVFCPGIGVEKGVETALVDSGYFGEHNKVFKGIDFFATSLRNGYGLLSPAVMVRKDCYEKISAFTLDMPHLGDWYLWLRWSLDYDVAYLSEPMVNYRLHDHNMMKDMLRRAPETVFADEVNLLWRARHDCKEKRLFALALQCEDILTAKYARAAACAHYDDVYWNWSNAGAHWGLSIAQCEEALRAGAVNTSDYDRLHRKFSVYLANQHWRHGNLSQARQEYARILRGNWTSLKVGLRWLILCLGLGRFGLFLMGRQRRNDYRMHIRSA
jgi:glycosyltransferase involved in cell wall biosynthesis